MSSIPLDWFCPAWLADAPHLPRFEVMDTRSALGVRETRTKRIDVCDLVKFHGHACDGLVRGAYALRALFDAMLGADQPIDRTDLVVVSKNSPCLGDVAAYLTGGRVRFGTHRLDSEKNLKFVVHRLSDELTFEVREEEGFFPALIQQWDAALLSGAVELTGRRELVAVNEAAQWRWVRDTLLATRPHEHYQARRILSDSADSEALPPAIMTDRRTDVINRGLEPPSEYRGPFDVIAAPTSDGTSANAKWEQIYAEGPSVLGAARSNR